MILRYDGKIVSDREKVADTFKKTLVNIEKTLKIDRNKQFLLEANNEFNPVLKAVKKYSAHISILRIKKKDE